MRRLELDFRGTGAPSPWAGPVLLALAIALMADLGVSYYEVRQAVADKEWRLARLERPAAGGKALDAGLRSVPAEEIALARETIARLALPWDNLFGALEGAASDTVAVLAVEPDPGTGSALISAEAKDYVAALNYVLQLEAAPTLKRVRMVRHEIRPQGPRATVAFSVSASWSEPR
jgi:hypothetical protein